MSLLLSGDIKLANNQRVPVDPLIGDVSLLLHGDGTNGKQNNTFLDSSTNNFTITRTGNPTQGSFSPYGKVGGSGYFDGSDELKTAAGTSTTFNDFSISGWVYRTGTSTFQEFGNIGNEASGRISFTWNGNNFQYNIFGQSNVTIEGTGRMPVNQWVYVVLTRTGSSLTLYYNGVLVATVTLSGTLGNTSGTYRTAGLIGYLSDLRIDNAAHPSPTVVPTSPVSATADTRLLLRFTNAGIVDSAAKNNLETVGNAQVSTAQSKFGGGSMYFAGTSSAFLTAPNNGQYSFGTGDFTVELFFRRDNHTNQFQSLVNVFSDLANAGNPLGYGWSISFTTSFQITAAVWPSNTASPVSLTNTGVAAVGTWYHVALVRSQNLLVLYVDGVNVGSTTLTAPFNITPNPSTLLNVGTYANRAWGNAFGGYIDDLRITKYARYTANFTPPTAAFPDI